MAITTGNHLLSGNRLLPRGNHVLSNHLTYGKITTVLATQASNVQYLPCPATDVESTIGSTTKKTLEFIPK